MKKIDYLTPAETLAIHAILLKKYGGTSGAVDMGLLESALFRPQTGYYPDLISQAAALMESLMKNHPFTDGNKRVAFAVTDIFLKINGYKFIIGSDKIYKEIMRMFDKNEMNFNVINTWLNKNTKKN